MNTTKTTHTPGPWEAGHYKMVPTVFWSRGNGCVPIAQCSDLPAIGDAEANARLIAAAPDLLAACKTMLDPLCGAIPAPDDVDATDIAIKLAHAAIAKAEGGH